MPMNYRQAVKLIKAYGGRFKSHGANHDEFEMPWGTTVLVPRRTGDFTRGVEDDIKKRATGAKRS